MAAQLVTTTILSAALAFCGLYLLRTDAGAPPREARASGGAQLDALEERVVRLEEQLEQLEQLAEDAGGEVRVSPRTDAKTSASLREVQARLDELEAKLRKPGQRPVAKAPVASAKEPAPRVLGRVSFVPFSESRGAKAEAKRVILDPAADVVAKIQAHKSLRRVEGAYTPQMIQALIRIGQTHAVAERRANVWTFFDGSTRSDMLIAPLLYALRHDASDLVRAEAAETLGDYTESPAVREALKWHAANDNSKSVRDKARRSVPGSWRQGR